ncbi:putative nuclease HARBI1 [Prorops nasuta]|uniref:putative nuclease HARBI1 n=1 Tax=Prorops nasuta TaxID=863751 RepID=UPI0034CE998D
MTAMSCSYPNDDENLSSEEELFELRNRIPIAQLRRKYLKDNENHFEIYDDMEFKRRYRFSKECIISGDIRKIHQSSISRIVKQISNCFAAELSTYIFLPNTPQHVRKTIEKFSSISNFSNVIGAIDCTHIMITNPGGPYGETFRNRKGWFSFNVQVVGGPNLEIMDIVIRHPGSAHDSLIFDRSAVRARFERNELNGILLGDNGYANKTYLLTPVLNPVTDNENRYNTAHIKTRNTVERLFGVWKRRFSCLHSGLRTKLITSAATIAACAVLHNISIRYNQNDVDDADVLEVDLQDEDMMENYNDEIDDEDYDLQTGLQFRNQFIATHFS